MCGNPFAFFDQLKWLATNGHGFGVGIGAPGKLNNFHLGKGDRENRDN